MGLIWAIPGVRYPAADEGTAENHTKGLRESSGTALDDEGMDVVHSWRFSGVEALNILADTLAKIC